MKKYAMVDDLRDLPDRVSLAYDGWQIIIGDKDAPVYINDLVYHNMDDLLKPFSSVMTSMCLNMFFGLIVCSRKPSSAGSEYSYIVYVRVDNVWRNDRYTLDYRIKYITTYSGKADKYTSFYYDSDKRNICRVDGNTNRLTVITRLPPM